MSAEFCQLFFGVYFIDQKVFLLYFLNMVNYIN